VLGCAYINPSETHDARVRMFGDTFVDSTSGTPVFFTYGGMIAHVLTYAAYRRTLASGALHAAGVTDFQDDPLAWPPVRPDGPTLLPS
jgi:hypothetical protein